MIAIMIADFFILKEDHSDRAVNVESLAVWFIGFLMYRKLMTIDLPIGSTVMDILLTVVLCIAVALVRRAVRSKSSAQA